MVFVVEVDSKTVLVVSSVVLVVSVSDDVT